MRQIGDMDNLQGTLHFVPASRRFLPELPCRLWPVARRPSPPLPSSKFQAQRPTTWSSYQSFPLLLLTAFSRCSRPPPRSRHHGSVHSVQCPLWPLWGGRKSQDGSINLWRLGKLNHICAIAQVITHLLAASSASDAHPVGCRFERNDQVGGRGLACLSPSC
jgi:hypothetical protein